MGPECDQCFVEAARQFSICDDAAIGSSAVDTNARPIFRLLCYVTLPTRAREALKYVSTFVRAGIVCQPFTVATAGTLSAQQSQQSSTQPSIINNDQDTQLDRTAGEAQAQTDDRAGIRARSRPRRCRPTGSLPSDTADAGGGRRAGSCGRSRAANGGTDVIPEHRAAARISPASTPYVLAAMECSGATQPSELAMAFHQGRHFHAGRCRLRWKDNGQCGVLEGSQAAIGGVVVETIETQ